MKWSNIVFIVLIIALAIPATLYIVKPRVVVETETIENIVPGPERIVFRSSSPDTVYKISHIVASPDTVTLLVEAEEEEWVYYSDKLFEDETTGMRVTSYVYAFSGAPVDSFGNEITIEPDRDRMIALLQDEIDRQVSVNKRKGFKNGLLWGAGTIVVTGTVLAIVLN